MSVGKTKKVLRTMDEGKCIGCYSCMLACARIVHQDFSPLKSAIRIKTSGGYQGKMVIDICRGCDFAPCADACPQGALTYRDGGGVSLKRDLCTGCFKCAAGCPAGVIYADKSSSTPVVCLQCGSCIEFCPHHILYMEEVHNVK